MTLTELADKVGVTVVNLSVLKNGRARAIRFSTLAALCQVSPAAYHGMIDIDDPRHTAWWRGLP